MTTFAGRPDTCPAWCITQHGELDGEEDHLHTGAGLRLARGFTAHLCASVDPSSGQTDGPYVFVESEEWTLEQARSIGHALIALTEQGTAGPAAAGGEAAGLNRRVQSSRRASNAL